MAVKIVVDVAQAHDGSLGRAHSFIDAVSGCGIDAIKFQTHIAEFESSPQEPWRVIFSFEDKTRYDYWKRMEFSREQWQGLFDHSRAAGLGFIGTPFSTESLEMLRDIGVNRWKLASGEISNRFLVRALAELKQPVIMSTGMSSWDEIDRTARFFLDSGVDLSILQCTSRYPVPPERVGLNVIDELRRRYRVPVGLSDHSGSIYASLAAVALGAALIEVHVCLSKYDFGPDTSSSLTVEQLRMLSEGVRQIETMLANPVDKDLAAASLAETHRMFTKSLYIRQAVPPGTVLTEAMLGAKKPCVGIPVTRFDQVVGRRAKHGLNAGDFIREEDLE